MIAGAPAVGMRALHSYLENAPPSGVFKAAPTPLGRSEGGKDGGVVMLVRDVLHGKGRNVVKVQATDSVHMAVRKLAEHNIGALVVEDKWMKLVGVFSERDFVNAIADHGSAALGLQVDALMSAPIVSCRSVDRIDAALATMTVGRIRHLPVIDNGTLQGIVSIGDLVKHRLDEKELEASVLLEISRMRA
ncbi:MAG TPA: CBS domain-containing protein [Acetobacteraceae bacterium]|jgi:CBS domain-containing protein